MGLRRIFGLLHVIGWIWRTPVAGSNGEGLSSMATTLARSHTIGFFTCGHSQGIGASRCSDQTQRNLVASLHAICSSVDTALLRGVHSSIPLRAQASFDVHDEHFEHLPL
ncbi:uncharacterized protein TNCV_4734361 [Trichonephila clavipes]|nr:uncharacterized protein TNCV_4734361 [Trichonephila clavipes]